MVKSILLNFATVMMLAVSAIAAGVEATLDRDSVPAGNGALLTLRITGEDPGKPEIPAVENLVMEPRGRSQQIQIVNGQTTASVTYTFVVGSQIPGDYQVPIIDVMVDGQKFSTQPLKLQVLDSAAAQAPAGAPQNPAGAGEEAEEAGEKRFGFLTVELAASERKHCYVGEIAPVRIQAWLPADSRANLRSGIQPEGKAFTLHNVSGQPQQTQEIKDGKRYLVVTWFGGISATKAGKFPASLSVDATVAVRDTAALKQPRQQRGGPFDDPFFDNVFDQMNTPMIQKDVTLKSDDQEIEVRPLPTQGRPSGFTGAVGNFKFDLVSIPADWKTGEPQQISARLSGTGNFALLNAPALTPGDGWKTYSGKDEFRASDEASFSGIKNFQFSAVALKGGARETALAFSFFDPAAGAYQTLTSTLKNIQITGEDIIEVKPVETPAAKEPEKKLQKLFAQHSEMSAPSPLLPLVSRPLFGRILALSAGLCLLGSILGWLRVRRDDPKRRSLLALEKAVREALSNAEKCAADGDVSGFFAAARLAIQQRLGALWEQQPQAITLAEILARIPSDSPVTRFFLEADRHEYNPSVRSEISPLWRSLLDEALTSITHSAR